MTDQMPTFDSFEELQEWMNKNSTGVEESESSKVASSPKKTSKSSAKKKPSKKKKPAKKDEANDLAAVEDPTNIWSSVHFYKRAGDTIESTRKDAKEEASFRNDNVLVFYHDHNFGEACESKCGGV